MHLGDDAKNAGRYHKALTQSRAVAYDIATDPRKYFLPREERDAYAAEQDAAHNFTAADRAHLAEARRLRFDPANPPPQVRSALHTHEGYVRQYLGHPFAGDTHRPAPIEGTPAEIENEIRARVDQDYDRAQLRRQIADREVEHDRAQRRRQIADEEERGFAEGDFDERDLDALDAQGAGVRRFPSLRDAKAHAAVGWSGGRLARGRTRSSVHGGAIKYSAQFLAQHPELEGQDATEEAVVAHGEASNAATRAALEAEGLPPDALDPVRMRDVNTHEYRTMPTYEAEAQKAQVAQELADKRGPDPWAILDTVGEVAGMIPGLSGVGHAIQAGAPLLHAAANATLGSGLVGAGKLGRKPFHKSAQSDIRAELKRVRDATETLNPKRWFEAHRHAPDWHHHCFRNDMLNQYQQFLQSELEHDPGTRNPQLSTFQHFARTHPGAHPRRWERLPDISAAEGRRLAFTPFEGELPDLTLDAIGEDHGGAVHTTGRQFHDGKIYKITSAAGRVAYIGSTFYPLDTKMRMHRNHYSSYKQGGMHYVSSFDVLKHPDAKITLIERCPGSSKRALEVREGYWQKRGVAGYRSVNRFKAAQHAER